MYLVDSDFDTEDEQFADDIEEVISNHVDESAGEGEATSALPRHTIGLKELQESLGCELIGEVQS